MIELDCLAGRGDEPDQENNFWGPDRFSKIDDLHLCENLGRNDAIAMWFIFASILPAQAAGAPEKDIPAVVTIVAPPYPRLAKYMGARLNVARP